MAIYKFFVCFEDDEDIQRVIEIKSNATFFDLHKAILKSIEFDDKHEASFYISDDIWRRGEEITSSKSRIDKDPENVFSIQNSKLSKYIYDPHQKFVYVYDFETEWTLHIELRGISMTENPKLEYPLVVRSSGKAPKQYRNANKIGAELEDDEFDYLTKNLLGGEEVQEGIDEEDLAGNEEDEESEEEENEFGFGDEESSENYNSEEEI